jgi:hypothetical protein
VKDLSKLLYLGCGLYGLLGLMCLSWGQSGQEKTVQNQPLNSTQPQTKKVSRLQVNTCPHLLKDPDLNLGLLDASYPLYDNASLRELIKKKTA